MRNIIDVINQIISYIPDQELNKNFIEKLESIVKSAIFSAPENQIKYWDDLSSILESYFHIEIRPQWQSDILKIVANKHDC